MNLEHIIVCARTYKRPNSIGILLDTLDKQATAGLFTYSIFVVSDNDEKGSVWEVVAEFPRRTKRDVSNEIEPEQNISLARNRAVKSSVRDYIAFFDNDQFPQRDRLLTLEKAQMAFLADGALGLIKPYFEEVLPIDLSRVDSGKDQNTPPCSSSDGRTAGQ